MQLSLTLSLLLSALTAHGTVVSLSSSSSSIMGAAAYFMTNDPSENWLISVAVSETGQAVLDFAYNTHGVGAHGLPNVNASDALFSQSSIAVSQSAGLLAAVNAGSNTVSVYTIDKNKPTDLTAIGKPIGSGGEFPQSVAFNAAGTSFCVLNGGNVNSVNCFSVNTKSGTVMPIANTLRSLGLKQTTPATGPAGAASQVLFSADGTQLYVTVKGVPPTPGYLAVWDIAADGSLSESATLVKPPTGGLLPFSMTPLPGKNALLVTDPALGLDIFDLTNGFNSTVAGGNSNAFAVPGQSAICWSQYSTETGHAYVVDAGTSTVSEISVGAQLIPSIVNQYTLSATGAIDSSIATIKKKDYMYILASGSAKLEVLSLNAPGKAQALQSVDLTAPLEKANVDVTNANLQGMAVYVI
uniref:3-carboxymuconate cyclase n=1 Tax=Mycena chlorophos TaxID=658473 RepID=A0ABQ0MBQ2_MYCCL|nr:predicted protein [Mycena chlorophos]